MGFEITDGTGKGNKAGVDRTNRLLTRTINENTFLYGAEEGDAYFIGAPIINLTSANESAILYIKNNEDSPLILGQFFIIAESTTGGSPNMVRVNFYRNPTSISSGTATSALNQNFGSSKVLNADIEYGVEGSTITGGALAATLSFPIGTFNTIDANLVLEKGSSVVISYDPPAGNTSMDVTFGTRALKYEENY